LNIVTGKINDPQAVLIRGIEKFNGPGKITKALEIDGTLNGKKLLQKNGLWIENTVLKPEIIITTRVGVDYAGEEWKMKPWRYIFRHPNANKPEPNRKKEIEKHITKNA